MLICRIQTDSIEAKGKTHFKKRPQQKPLKSSIFCRKALVYGFLHGSQGNRNYRTVKGETSQNCKVQIENTQDTNSCCCRLLEGENRLPDREERLKDQRETIAIAPAPPLLQLQSKFVQLVISPCDHLYQHCCSNYLSHTQLRKNVKQPSIP